MQYNAHIIDYNYNGIVFIIFKKKKYTHKTIS